MKGTSFKETNRVFTAGGNPNTDQLPVCLAKIQYDGEQEPTNFIVTKFKLDKEEIDRIKETGELWICVMGQRLPPLLPTVYHPFKEHGFKPIENE